MKGGREGEREDGCLRNQPVQVEKSVLHLPTEEPALTSPFWESRKGVESEREGFEGRESRVQCEGKQ